MHSFILLKYANKLKFIYISYHIFKIIIKNRKKINKKKKKKKR